MNSAVSAVDFPSARFALVSGSAPPRSRHNRRMNEARTVSTATMSSPGLDQGSHNGGCSPPPARAKLRGSPLSQLQGHGAGVEPTNNSMRPLLPLLPRTALPPCRSLRRPELRSPQLSLARPPPPRPLGPRHRHSLNPSVHRPFPILVRVRHVSVLHVAVHGA